MKIIISPAKSLDFETQLPIKNFSVPDFLTESKIINQLLKKKSPSQLKSLMSISDKLAELNWNRNNSFKTPFDSDNSRPSIFTFSGDVYSGLDAFSLSEDQIKHYNKKGYVAPIKALTKDQVQEVKKEIERKRRPLKLAGNK